MCICIFNDLVKRHRGCVLLIRLLNCLHTAMTFASNWSTLPIVHIQVLLGSYGMVTSTLRDATRGRSAPSYWFKIFNLIRQNFL